MISAKARLGLSNLLVLAALAGFLGWIGWFSVTQFDYHWDWLHPLRFFFRSEEGGGWSSGLLVDGFLMTLRLTLWGGVLCVAIGLGIGLLRSSQLSALRLLGAAYVELIRNTPPLVFIFIMYFFVSSQLLPPSFVSFVGKAVEQSATLRFMFGDAVTIENFAAGLLCVALYEAAYMAEIVRGGIQSIEKGQWEAGTALGMSRFKVMRLIVLPQVLRRIVPPTTNQIISLVKDSSIISVISVQELTFAGIEVATTTGRLFETLILISLLYFAICWPISMLLRKTEAKAAS